MPTGMTRKHRAFVLLMAVLAMATGAKEALGNTDKIAEQHVWLASKEIRKALGEIQKIPGAFPAVAAVVVQGESTPLMHVHGIARVGQPGAVDRKSQFYIASQTKSFMALLAAHLDENGILPLDTTMAQIWPQLTLPAPADPAKITMADLLSHQERLKTDTLNFLTAYVRNVPASDYPAMLSRYTQARSEGFRYANIGDLIYGAALETRTGKNWQEWLQQEVLRPLKLDHIHSRVSQVPARRLTWNHRWDGRTWIAMPPKPDELMHAAGGLLASPEDMAAWMRINLSRQSPTGKPSTHSVEIAQRPIAKAALSDGDFVCDGYSLGWYSCTYKQQSVLMHPGSYPGVVSVTVLIPALHAGLSLVVNSDSAMEGLQLELIKAFIGLASGQAGETERLRKAVADYPGRLARTVTARADTVHKTRQEEVWNGWNWKPSREEMARYVGLFQNDRLGSIEVRQTADGLEAQLGAMQLALTPASPGLFGAGRSALDAPEIFRYEADIGSLRWNNDVFTRKPGEPGITAHQKIKR